MSEITCADRANTTGDLLAYAKNCEQSIDDLSKQLAAEQEARKADEADKLLWKTTAENYCDMYKEQKQRAEAAEALIKASREQEPVGNVITRPLMPDECEAKRIVTWYAKQFAGNFYAQPPIPHDVAELQRQLEDAKVPEGWKLVPVEPTDAMIDFVEYEWNRDTKNRTWGDVYKAMLSAAPTTDQPKE